MSDTTTDPTSGARPPGRAGQGALDAQGALVRLATGYRLSQMLHVAAKLGIADLLSGGRPGPLVPQQILLADVRAHAHHGRGAPIAGSAHDSASTMSTVRRRAPGWPLERLWGGKTRS